MLGVFYYPWTGGKNTLSPNRYRHWVDNGHNPPLTWASNYLPDTDPLLFNPTNELYDAKDTNIIKHQLNLMKNAGIEFIISSWWGQNSYEDQALKIINTFLQSTENPYKTIRFCIYYEKEGFANVPINEINSDIDYIKSNFANSPYYLYGTNIDPSYPNNPVIFVYNADDITPSDAQKWKTIRDNKSIYTVLKIFPNWQNYTNLGDSWHQYAPATAFEQAGSYSAYISPGFYKYHELSPRLLREDFVRFENNVISLKNANVPIKLIETYNEWGEGTGIEPAQLINHDDINGFTSAKPSYGTGYLDIIAKYFLICLPTTCDFFVI